MRVVNAGKKVDIGNISVVVRVIRSVDFFRAIFVGFVRVSFCFSAHWCRLSERRTNRRSPTAEEEPQ